MIGPENIVPPRWPLKLMRVFIKKQYLEEIEGDMEELFHDNIEHLSVRKARRIYIVEMLRLLRPILIKNLTATRYLNNHGMFKNYFKVSSRGLMKNPLNSFINIFGLAIAIGITVMVYGFTRWTYGTDQFHEHKNEVFLATFFANREGVDQQYGITPRPLAEMLKADFAAVKKICRIEDKSVVMKNHDNVFNERVRLVDPTFLEMFTFPLKWGTSNSLNDLSSIILSEDMSIKYFGEENPIGQSILIKFDNDISKAFKITGVAKKFPSARTITFHFLINLENIRTAEPTYNFQDWKSFVNATLIQVDNPADIEIIEKGMAKYKTIQNQAVSREWALTSFSFEPIATLNQKARNIRDDISRDEMSDNYKSVIFLVCVGIFMLMLACFNYINIAIVSAAKRLKEIGVRKSIGASRSVVIVQFLTENVVITSFALILGVILGAAFFIPWFEHMNSFSMEFSLSDKNLWIFLPVILILTGIASGIYPAFYISKFHVVGILKGAVKFGTKSPLTKLFLGLQLILACVFITSAVMFAQNSSYLTKRNWGYNPNDALYVTVPDLSAYEKLLAVVKQNPDVTDISGSSQHLGKKSATVIMRFPDRDYEADELGVDPTYFKTMGLQVIDGRGFNDHDGSDRQAVVVNELLMKNMTWEQPIGQIFHIDSIQYEVVGVVKDFHSNSFYYPIKPTIFKVADKSDYRYLSMRVREGAKLKAYQDLQARWSKLYPELPFDGGYQEDVWGYYFEELGVHAQVWRVFAIVAVLLAGMGLYGLITLNVTSRTKEFSIRKVLGAGMRNLAGTITNQYLILFVVALTIGAPLSYALIKTLLEMAYTYHMPITFSGVIIAVSILVVVLLLTISTQIRKVLKSNPVNGLKVE